MDVTKSQLLLLDRALVLTGTPYFHSITLQSYLTTKNITRTASIGRNVSHLPIIDSHSHLVNVVELIRPRPGVLMALAGPGRDEHFHSNDY